MSQAEVELVCMLFDWVDTLGPSRVDFVIAEEVPEQSVWDILDLVSQHWEQL